MFGIVLNWSIQVFPQEWLKILASNPIRNIIIIGETRKLKNFRATSGPWPSNGITKSWVTKSYLCFTPALHNLKLRYPCLALCQDQKDLAVTNSESDYLSHSHCEVRSKICPWTCNPELGIWCAWRARCRAQGHLSQVRILPLDHQCNGSTPTCFSIQ